MFNFYSYSKSILITIVWVIHLTLLIQVSDLYYNFMDLYTRLWLNEFFLNTLYFYWTSFWYLTAVVLIVKIASTIIYKRNTSYLIWVTLVFIIGYGFTIIDYWSFNYTHLGVLKHEYQLNTLLTNSINKYHPFIFYFTLIWLYVTTLYINSLSTRKSFYLNHQKLYLIRNTNFFLPMIYVTLGLGSWWALQEGSWGGWWNWDASEVFGLMVMLFYLYFIHKSFKTLIHKDIVILNNIFISLLLFIYSLIQLNFDLVSHNFGTKINQFINSDQLFYIFLLSITTYVVYLLFKNQSLGFQYVFSKKVVNVSPKVLILALLTFVVISLSFNELINNFMWTLYQVNILNIINLTSYYTPATLFVLYLLLTRFNILTSLVFIYLTCYLNTMYMLINSIVYMNKIYKLHLFIYMIIFLSYYYINQSLIDWDIKLNNNYTFVSDNIMDGVSISAKLNTTYTELTSTSLLDNQLVSIGWNFIQWSTNQQIHTFQHDLSSNLTFQNLHSSLFEYLHNISVLDYSIQALALITFIIILCLQLNRNNKIIILF